MSGIPKHESQGHDSALALGAGSKGAHRTPEDESKIQDSERDMIQLTIYLDGRLRKIVAATGLLIALMAIGAYLWQWLKN